MRTSSLRDVDDANSSSETVAAEMYRQMLGYVPSTVIPAVVSFVMIYVYTRLLAPAEYGTFSLIFSAMLVVQTSFYYAIPVALTRFYPEALANDRRDGFLAECYALFYVLSFLIVVLVAATSFATNVGSPTLWVSAITLLLARSALVLNQSVNRISFRVLRFNIIECVHSLLGFALGIGFVYVIGPTAEAIVLGLAVAAVACALVDLRPLTLPFRHDWKAFSRGSISRLISFSLPLIVVDITVCLLQLSDRFLLSTLGGVTALGIYTVAYNLVERPTTLICTAITTATFPVAVQVLQDQGVAASGKQAGKNGTILFAMVLPSCVGLALTAPYVVAVMIGAEFRTGAAALIPMMCLTALCRGLSTHFVDHLFHLAGRTNLALWVYAPAAAATIILNLLLIPRFGGAGAAWAGLICQAGALMGGWIVSRSIFPVQLELASLGKVLAAVLPMAAMLHLMTFASSWYGLLQAVGLGASLFLVAATVLNIGGVRGGVLWLIRGPLAASMFSGR